MIDRPRRTLDDLRVGQSGRVVDVEGDPKTGRRLLEMGLVPGTPVQVIRMAPFRDPIEIRLRGYHLSLRRCEARGVMVQTTAGS